MSGTKSVGQVLRDSSHIGNYDPQETNINFAVPNSQTIINYTFMDYDFPKEIPPGIITKIGKLSFFSESCYNIWYILDQFINNVSRFTIIEQLFLPATTINKWCSLSSLDYQNTSTRKKL
jgi:hypothetical protein